MSRQGYQATAHVNVRLGELRVLPVPGFPDRFAFRFGDITIGATPAEWDRLHADGVAGIAAVIGEVGAA